MGKLGRLKKKRTGRRQYKAVGGRCVADGCTRVARSKLECKLCEQKGRDHVVVACQHHAVDARDKLKAHVLRKHPGVWPAWVLALMRGEG